MSPLVADLSTSVRRALYGKMAGDTTLNNMLSTQRPQGRSKSIYYGHAPDGAGFPYVIFNKQSGTPVYTFKTGPAVGDGHAIADNELWLIKGVTHVADGFPDSLDSADNIASRLDALLTDASLSMVATVAQLYLRRETDVAFPEEEDGETYFHHGALYRLMYSAT